jgi:membrane glycosyltransferase
LERPPEKDQRKSRWGPPPDSDLIGIPLVLGIVVALLAIALAFVFLHWAGLIVLGVVLIAALAISYRVVTGSESQD